MTPPQSLSDDIEDLQDFVYRCQAMLDQPLIQADALRVQFKVEWQATAVMRLTSTRPNDAAFLSFLVYLRPFVLNKERLFLPKILNMLMTRLGNDTLRLATQQAREHWTRVLRGTTMQLTANNTELRADDVWDLFVNGLWFHSDREKARRAQAIIDSSAMTKQFAEQILYQHALDLVRLIVVMRNIIVRALTDADIS